MGPGMGAGVEPGMMPDSTGLARLAFLTDQIMAMRSRVASVEGQNFERTLE